MRQNSRRKIVFLASFVLALIGVQSVSAQTWSDEKSAFTDLGSKSLIPGLAPHVAVGVSINGNPVYAKGFGGNPNARGATGPNTLFHIGSLTKQFTAAAVLALIEDAGSVRRQTLPTGAPILKLFVPSLDSPIGAFIPATKSWSKTGPVRLRNLLNMQSGFPNYTDAAFDALFPGKTQPVGTEALLELIDKMVTNTTPTGAPGSGYAYSNTNYFLLAGMIDAVQTPQKTSFGNNYHAYMRNRIFTRAGLSHTGFIGDEPPGLGLAKPPGNLLNGPLGKPSWSRGAGDIVSTVNDQLLWHKALMSGQVLSTKSRDTMFTPVAPVGTVAPGLSNFYGMGWNVLQTPPFEYYDHNGFITGYSSHAGIFINRQTGAWVSAVMFAANDNVNLGPSVLCLAQLAMASSPKLATLNPFAKTACNIP